MLNPCGAGSYSGTTMALSTNAERCGCRGENNHAYCYLAAPFELSIHTAFRCLSIPLIASQASFPPVLLVWIR